MKNELKDLMQELQMAFNESVCESDRIAEILADIKRSGYEVMLALEVTIGVAGGKQADADQATQTVVQSSGTREFDLTAQDREFLQGLHIGA